MERREFIAAAGLGIVGIAGCTGGQPADDSTATLSPSPTPSPSATPNPTPTPTPEARAPEITHTSLLTDWQDFGDVLDNQIDAVGQGASAVVGFRYESEIHDGTSNITEQVRVFGPEGDRVDLKKDTSDQLVGGSGVSEWEHALLFDTATWNLGNYEYEVLIRDNVSNKVSENESGEFDLNTPLGSNEVSLIDVEAPDTVPIGEDYSFTLHLENISSRDGSVVTTVSAKFKSSDTWTTVTDSSIWVNIDSGDANSWESRTTSFSSTGTIQYRLDSINEIWVVEVTEN